MKTGVIIARFQTPYLHEGHTHLIHTIQQKHNKLVVVLGVAPVVGTRKNPYDYHTRERLIKKQYPNIVVLPLSDHPSDAIWSHNLDTLLNNAFPNEKFVLYGSRDSFIPFYSGKLETTELPEHGDYSATELRAMFADLVFDSQDFRAGIIYAYNHQYTKVYPTVDVAMFRNDRREILLGSKSINNKWRLIGGFADPEDESLEAAARRELSEEVGAVEVGDLSYEMSTRVDDWRYRNELDKIITTVFSCDYIFGTPEGQDDIAQVDWFKVADLNQMIQDDKITPEHLPLISFLYQKYHK
ncbi:MAG TPA: NUDIX domain-containing protein [Cytophagales bacterium]|nr:NUDIX domain-containing protein [Cytophagales bacterium]